MRNFPVDRGRTFTEHETDSLARVACIGTTTATNLFGTDDPLGETVKLNGINFKIIGVLKEKGSQGWSNPDDQFIIPYTTAMRILFGMKYIGEIDVLGAHGTDLVALAGQPPAPAPGAAANPPSTSPPRRQTR